MKWEDRNFNHQEPGTIKGLVSIILPTYNRTHFLFERLDEIIKQKYDNYEVIIVNDGGKSIAELMPRDFRIRLVELPTNSQTVSIPRAIGISHAYGEFICHADDDVKFHKNKITTLLNHLGDASLVYGNRLELDIKTGSEIQAPFIENWNPLLNSGIDNGQMLYRKSVYEKIPYIISTHACDFYLAKEIYKDWGPFNSVNENVCTYIWHDTNRTYSEGRKHVPLNIEAFKDHFNVHNGVLTIHEK